MRKYRYESGTGLETFELDAPDAVIGTANEIRGREWAYTLGSRSIENVYRAASEHHLSVFYPDKAQADRFRRIADRDVFNGTPGKMVVNGWSQRCFVVAQEVDEVWHGSLEATVTLVLLDGVWSKPRTVEFSPEGADIGEAFLDVPYDLPYDLSVTGASTKVEGSVYFPSPLGIRFYGPCEEPKVTVGSNLYKVGVRVPDGGILTVDPLSSPKSVTLTLKDGTKSDVYPQSERGNGKGSGSYIFETLPVGTHSVSWDGSFRFDLIVYEQEGEPEWSL